MKKIINLTILSTIILSLSFIPAIPTNAASKVNITYYLRMAISKKLLWFYDCIKKKLKKSMFFGIVKCKTSSEDILNFLVMESSDEDKDKPFSYSIQYANCKLKNVINIKKTTSMNVFLKNLV
ncbi:hypothetical protein NQ558_07585 [Eubacterium ventriosum]|uniref:hypothetical protein n=1 Tax=Eubacterium ventriosum TaxID=39496 RepID=UPI0021A67B93|nr:hypothetical protein [Eubacterium ventriosum]UWP34983.1 hypothetical protein NQ558_07585 [Eubacterium ventriosum]